MSFEKKLIVYGGGHFECGNDNTPDYQTGAKSVLKTLSGTSRNLTDANIFYGTGSDVTLYRTCCSSKMKCNYKTGSKSLISNNDNVWFVSFNDGAFSIACDYNDSANPRITNGEVYADSVTSAVFSFTKEALSNLGRNYTNKGMFSGCTKLTSCEVPCEMNRIADDTFSGCTSLTSYTKNEDFVTSIGKRAFKGCTSMKALLIPKFSNISTSSFEDCSSATTIKWHGLTGDTNGYTSVKCNLDTIPDSAFKNCIKLSGTTFSTGSTTGIVIPSGITGISVSAFENCSGFTKLYLNGVTDIGTDAFISCDKLQSVSRSDTAYNIGTRAFYNCSALSSFTFYSGNEDLTIGSSAFAYCNLLASNTFYSSGITIDMSSSSNGSTTIGNEAFAYNTTNSGGALIALNPRRENFIGTGIFYKSSLTDVYIKGFDNIPQSTFADCQNLTNIEIVNTNNMNVIDRYAFSGCSSLTSITIPDTVTDINNSAFYNCSSLTSIDIPNSVTYIGSNAFYGCSGLTSITVEATTPPTLGTSALNNTNNCPIFVPSGSVETYQTTSGWSTYATRIQAIQ